VTRRHAYVFSRLLAVLVVVAGLGACATADDEDAAPTPKPDDVTSEEVTFGEQIAQIRGHHRVAVALYSDGDTKGAATHTGHPVEELLAAVNSEVKEHDADLAAELEAALRGASRVVADDGEVSDLEDAVAGAGKVAADAEDAVVGDPDAVTYRASVVAALLATVGHEYEEAVQDGKVELLAEYQDAYGFLQIAKDDYDAIRSDVAEGGAKEAGEIDEDFETLDDAFADLDPPSSPAPVDDVERATSHIGHELEETVDAVLLEEVDADAAFANIDRLLTEILDTYEDGDAEEAAELAAEAYLENYELVEADVIEHAPEINEELEPILGSELRQRIREDVPVAELRELIDEARRLLVDARDAVVEAVEEH
jgi:hypothetical protein